MAALDFPDAPLAGTRHSVGGKTWVFTAGGFWQIDAGQGGSTVGVPEITDSSAIAGSIPAHDVGATDPTADLQAYWTFSTDGGITFTGQVPLDQPIPADRVGQMLAIETRETIVRRSAPVGPITAPSARPAAPTDAQWSFTTVWKPTGQTANYGVDVITVDPALGFTDLFWSTSAPTVDEATAHLQSEPCVVVDLAKGQFRPVMRPEKPQPPARQWFEFNPTAFAGDEQRRKQFRIYGVKGGQVSDMSTAKTVAAPAGGPVTPLPVSAKSIPLPTRNKAEFDLKMQGGGGMQFMRGYATSKADPGVILAVQDTGVLWGKRSFAGKWFTPRCDGLGGGFGEAIWIHPRNARRVVAAYGAGYNSHKPEWAARAGLYLSTDFAERFTLTKNLAGLIGTNNDRWTKHTIAHDPTTEANEATTVLYFAYEPRPNGGAYLDGWIEKSTDGGATWARVTGEALTQAKFGVVYMLRHHPTIARRLLMATQRGLFQSLDGGANWTAYGNLPAGACRCIDVKEWDKNVLYASVDSKGLYKSTTASPTFARLGGTSMPSTYAILNFAISADRRRIVVCGQSSVRAMQSQDGGATFAFCNIAKQPGDTRTFTAAINNTHGYFVWHETDPNLVVAQGNQYPLISSDGGRNFVYDGEGFDGNSGRRICFDHSNPRRRGINVIDRSFLETDTAWDYKTPGTEGMLSASKKALEEAFLAKTGKALSSIQAYSGCILPDGRRIINVGNNGNCIPSVSDDGSTYVHKTTAKWGNGFFTDYLRADPRIVFSGPNRSTNRGDAWASMPCEFMGIADQGRVIFGATGQTIMRSIDNGVTWANWYVSPNSLGGNDTKALAGVDYMHPGRVYVRRDIGGKRVGIARVEGAATGAVVETYDISSLLPAWMPVASIQSIDVDQHDSDRIAFALEANGHVPAFYSADRGKTWEPIDDVPYQRSYCQFDPEDGTLYVYSNHGTFVRGPDAAYKAAHGITETIYDRQRAYLVANGHIAA